MAHIIEIEGIGEERQASGFVRQNRFHVPSLIECIVTHAAHFSRLRQKFGNRAPSTLPRRSQSMAGSEQLI